MNFPTNQNRHLYVIKRVRDAANEALQQVGDIKVKVISDSKGYEDPMIQFFYMGPGGAIATDRVQLKNITYAKAAAAATMRRPLKKIKVTLNSAINSGAPIPGEDYVLRIAFRQFHGMSDEDQYFKDAAVHVTSATSTAKEFYKAMVKALNLSFSREVGATKNGNPYLEFSAGTAGSEDGIYITEKPQDYVTGVAQRERVYFEVFPTTIYDAGDEVIWAAQDATTGKYFEDVTDASNYLANGPDIAELEWFCTGERGDQYKYKGWPNYIPTTYLVDASKEYDVFELHHAFTDTGVNSYRSEKDITFVADASDTLDVTPEGSDTAVAKQVIDVLLDNIQKESGLDIARMNDYSNT